MEKKDKKTILILTGNFGKGHISAACAVKEELEEIYEDADIVIFDLFDYIFPVTGKIVHRAFESLAGNHHRLYNVFNKQANMTSVPMHRLFVMKFKKLCMKYEPDLFVSTWPIGAKYIGAYKKDTGCETRYITCITDITSSGGWLSDATDAYIVGDEITRNHMVSKGISSEKIFVGGIPVRREFKKGCRKPEKPQKEILMMGGGLGIIPRVKDMLGYLSTFDDVHTTVITGKNKQLYEELHGLYRNTEVKGYTDDLSRLMNSADLIITKAGGVTLFEAIYTETPLLVIDPFLDHERINAAYIENKQIGKVMRFRNDSWKKCIDDALQDDGYNEMMKSNMRRIKAGLEGHGLIEAIDEIRRDA